MVRSFFNIIVVICCMLVLCLVSVNDGGRTMGRWGSVGIVLGGRVFEREVVGYASRLFIFVGVFFLLVCYKEFLGI